MGEDEMTIPGNSDLLEEILKVLKRIDGHLEAQESRIGFLDAKLTEFTSNVGDDQISNTRKQTKASFESGSSPESARKKSLPKTVSPPKPRDLRLQIANRKDSIESRGTRGSVASHEPRPWPGTYAWGSSGPKRVGSGRTTPWGSMSKALSSSPKTTTISRTGTWHSIPPPPTLAEIERIEVVDDLAYSKYPPPQEWITTRSLGRALDVKYDSAEARALWTRYVGDSWTIPPDGRIEMTFQQHLLERLDKDQVTDLLQTLRDVSYRLEYQRPDDFAKRGSFRVTDFGFDPGNEQSVWEYRAEVFTAQYRDPSISNGGKRPTTHKAHSAPWKRMMPVFTHPASTWRLLTWTSEVRGLSKELIDEHVTWTQNFRDPWTEALPLVSPILPFLTDRERDFNIKKYTGMNAVSQALYHHQRCLRESPSNDDHLTFHITFYEVVDMVRDEDLDGEIWRSGKLHSDNNKDLEKLFGIKTRRIRDSACTIVLVPDQDARYWTSIYLCPNNFDLVEKIPATIMTQNAQEVLSDLVDFSMRIVVNRWNGIANYFSGLIGHRDILSDPDAHDSLLFDDDTFSRSRKYFWAINYLTELDDRISWNIVILEKDHQRSPFPQMSDRLDELQDLRSRLRRLKEEAIALRDGLFSASGVIESRASTRLGENVKLLTFVSIFFLPLSFCMSIWSVNTTIFTLKALLIAVILVGLGTYLLVFNLNNMVNFWSRIYDKRKKKLITQMKQDPDHRWKEQGNRFAAFKPKQETLKPSEWVIGLFIMHKIATWSSLRRRLRRNPEAPRKEEHGEADRAQEWPGFQAPRDTDWPKTGDPLKITKTQIMEKVVSKGPLSRLNKAFRRDALSSENV